MAGSAGFQPASSSASGGAGEGGVADANAPARVEAASCRFARGMKAARRRFYLGQRPLGNPARAMSCGGNQGNGQLELGEEGSLSPFLRRAEGREHGTSPVSPDPSMQPCDVGYHSARRLPLLAHLDRGARKEGSWEQQEEPAGEERPVPGARCSGPQPPDAGARGQPRTPPGRCISPNPSMQPCDVGYHSARRLPLLAHRDGGARKEGGWEPQEEPAGEKGSVPGPSSQSFRPHPKILRRLRLNVCASTTMVRDAQPSLARK